MPIGQAAIVQQLQQHVEDFVVRLLDLVEQHHAVRPPAHRLGQLTAFVVADVTRRRADQARDRVLLLILAHVDAHHRVFVVEQEFRQRFGQLGLAHARRAEEHERADRPVGILQARAARRTAFDTTRIASS